LTMMELFGAVMIKVVVVVVIVGRCSKTDARCVWKTYSKTAMFDAFHRAGFAR
jgi:hypothetical protein